MTWNDLPKEIQDLMLERQYEQTGKKNPSIFEENLIANKYKGGFNWSGTLEESHIWSQVLEYGNFEYILGREDYAAYLKLKQEFEQYKKESIKWGVEDFLSLEVEGYHITPENAQKALERMIEMHDASIGINWEVVRFWFEEFATPSEKYYVLKGTKNFYKKGKDRTIFVGEGDYVNMISVQTDNNIPTYYEECTEQEFIAAYTKVKQLLNDVKI